MLAFAALMPFTTDLTHRTKKCEDALANAVKAAQSLEAEFYAAKPDVLIVLDASTKPTDFLINTAPIVTTMYGKEKLQLPTDVQLAYHLREARPEGYALVLKDKRELSDELAVPIYFLTRHISHIKILSIELSKQSPSILTSFGQHLYAKIHDANKRVAVIGPAPYHTKKHNDKELEQSILRIVENRQAFDLLRLSEEKKSSAYDLRSLTVMETLLKTVRHVPDIMFYDASLGLRYIVANFSL